MPVVSGSSLMAADIDFAGELNLIRLAVAKATAEVRGGKRAMLPGQALFLDDGRVLCRERQRGDSRYPYGADGFNFWVTAGGHMHANRGLYFLFLPAHDGDEPSIAFFAGRRKPGSDKCESFPVLPAPFVAGEEHRIVDRYTVLGHDAAYFVAQSGELLTGLRVFVDMARTGHPQIHFSLLIENLTDEQQDVFASSYMNPFCRHQFVETSEDRWFKTIRVNTQGSGSNALPPFEITTNEDVNRFQSISNHALIRRAVCLLRNGSEDPQQPSVIQSNTWPPAGELSVQTCTSRIGYLGSPRRGLASASFLTTGRLARDVDLTVFNDLAVAGDLLRFVLPPSGSIRCDYVFSIPQDETALAAQLCQPVDPRDVDRTLQAAGQRNSSRGSLGLSVGPSRSGDLDAATFNRFLPFLKKQVEICALLKGYMHPAPNSLIGIRDVFQAIEGHLFDQPAEARAKILEALDFVLVDGRCPRQYSLPANGSSGRADLREFVDQGVWVISTVYTYLAATGDDSILEETVGYHQVRPNDRSVIEPAAQRDSVLEHLLRIVDFLDRQRDPATGLVRALYGDWNDALDGLGTTVLPGQDFGSGVSVMTSLQLYQNCAELLEILERFSPGKWAEKATALKRIRTELRDGLLRCAVVAKDSQRRIVHGWGDRMNYFVGSFQDSDGVARDGLTSNAFWVLSGMLEAEPTLKTDILAAFDRLDSPYGLKTFEPGFAADAPGVGRITKLPMGSAENAAVYIHATTFAIAALFRMGQPRRAWDQIIKILPFSAHHRDPSHSPFVMPNSYVDNAALNLTGQSMNDWQTGCSNVLLKLLIRYVFGFDPGLDHLKIAPASWRPFESITLEAIAQGRRIRVVCVQGGVPRRTIQINGMTAENTAPDDNLGVLAATIAYSALKKTRVNEIMVIDPLDG